MQSPANITFRHMQASPEVRQDIETRIADLEKFHHHVVSCNVVVTGPSNRHEHGQEFHVQLTVQVPGEDIAVSDSLGQSEATQDLNLLLHSVFEVADRKLREQARMMGGREVKHHAEILHGKIDRIFEGEGYGFIKSDDGNDVYFEEDNLTNSSWEKLRVDMKVRFREGDGDKGPYAMNVHVMT
jgi:cold shock CspA family protein/ribosome-associated translation inhibitor RaiA